jgi:putative transposase
MSRYRRFFVPGGTYFFTVTLADRTSDALVRNIDLLRTVYTAVRRRLPFDTLAICILPEHLHAIWALPEGDADFPKRWQLIKIGFSRELPSEPMRSRSKIARGEKGIWQRRYWEHAIRDDGDLARHVDYIHFNPVAHGLAPRVQDWPHSSFHAHVAAGLLPRDWGGDMRDTPPRFGERAL